MSTTRSRKTSTGQGPLVDSIAESAKRQIQETVDVAQDALISGAWAYPLLGIAYLCTHPALIKPLLPSLVKGVVVSAGIVVAMFFFTYLPQVAVLAFVTGPLAFAAAIPLVLAEAYAIVNTITRSFLFDQASTDLFDAVLVQKGQVALVQRGRQVSSSGNTGKQLGRLLSKPLSRLSLDSMVRYVLSLPLNFIPVMGTVFFLAFNGYKAGPGYHARYFQLKGFDKAKRAAFIQSRRGAYSAFGAVTVALNLIPIASVLFSFTSNVGAALWAAKLETKTAPSGSGSDRADARKDSIEATLPSAESKREL